jgi:hypothetical protein
MPSRVITAFDYDESRNELTVRFVSGRVYVYSLIAPAIMERMRTAFSKGSFFNREIRNRYPVREVLLPPEVPPATPASTRSASQSDGSRRRE